MKLLWKDWKMASDDLITTSDKNDQLQAENQRLREAIGKLIEAGNEMTSYLPGYARVIFNRWQSARAALTPPASSGRRG